MFFLIYFIEVHLIYNIVLISAVKQSGSVIHIYILFHILFLMVFYRILNIFNSSLCYTVGPYCLSILYMIVCIC